MKSFTGFGTPRFQITDQTCNPPHSCDVPPKLWALISIPKRYTLRTEKTPFFVPCHTIRSEGRVGLKGIAAITFASSILKIELIRLVFHPRRSESIRVETAESTETTIGGDYRSKCEYSSHRQPSTPNLLLINLLQTTNFSIQKKAEFPPQMTKKKHEGNIFPLELEP
jgi:hypothetical protein